MVDPIGTTAGQVQSVKPVSKSSGQDRQDRQELVDPALEPRDEIVLSTKAKELLEAEALESARRARDELAVSNQSLGLDSNFGAE